MDTTVDLEALERQARPWLDGGDQDSAVVAWAKTCLALITRVREAEAALERQLSEIVGVRRWLWLHHGCPPETLYGDDGEMQCNAASCCKDFRRDHLSDLFAHLRARQQAEIARLTQRVQALRTALLSMVEWHGGVHGEDCPEDDTCDCEGRTINNAVNAALREDQP